MALLIQIFALWSLYTIIFCVYLVETKQHVTEKYSIKPTSHEGKEEWDHIIFAQSWGYSSCLEFRDKYHSKNFICRNEEKPAIWNIHGIWPSRSGVNGPSFCSRKEFNLTQLDPIRDLLNEYWYDTDKSKDGSKFWSYEWKKHGTCGLTSSLFDTELKYFSTAIELRKRFDLYKILKENGIVPKKDKNAPGYPLSDFTEAFKKSFQDNTVKIQCLGVKKSDAGKKWTEYFLLEVRVCLDKDLKQISCQSKSKPPNRNRRSTGTFHLPCPTDSPIKYFDPQAVV